MMVKKNRLIVLFLLGLLVIQSISCSRAESGQEPSVSPPAEEQSPPPEEQSSPGDEIQIEFHADRTALQPGECTILFWKVEGGGFGANLNGDPVERTDEREVCVGEEPQAFVLGVDMGDRMENREIVIDVKGMPPEKEFSIKPPQGDLPDPVRTLLDADSSIRAYENRAVTGDNFLNNLYERPFTSQDMVYQPDLDIYSVDFAYDEDFYYFTITLNGMNPDKWGLNGMYGVEFDRKLTGRGDLIVWAENVQKEWSLNNITAYLDNNGDVGGPSPMLADEGFKGSGYDQRLELAGDRVAFARISPTDQEVVQFAVSRALLENPTEFLWGAWADNGLKDVSKFDYNDTMGPTAAGSPINTDDDYPLGDLYNLDNTCRLPFGFDQMGASYRGMCITLPPAAAGPNCVTTCTGIRPPVCTTVCN